MAFNVSSFQSTLTGGGARPSLFSFEITGNPAGGTSGGLADLNMLCSVSALPGLSVTPIERHYYGRVTKIPGDMVFADLTTTILNDEDFVARTQIEMWMASMNTHEGNRRTFSAGMGKEGGTGTLMQYGKTSEVDSSSGAVKKAGKLAQIVFTDCFPTTLGEITLSFDSVSEIEQFDVTWAYQYYTMTLPAEAT